MGKMAEKIEIAHGQTEVGKNAPKKGNMSQIPLYRHLLGHFSPLRNSLFVAIFSIFGF